MNEKLAKRSRTRQPKGIAFLIAPEDEGCEVKAVAIFDGNVWKTQPSPERGEAVECLRIAFLLTAKAYLLALQAETAGGIWPTCSERPALGRPLLFTRTDPDKELWGKIGKDWSQILRNLETPDRFKGLSKDFATALKSFFPKHGKSEENSPPPVVAMATQVPSQNLIIASLPVYNAMSGHPSEALPEKNDILSGENLRRSAITPPDAVADILQRILLSRYAAEHQTDWWLHYACALLSFPLDHYIPLKTCVLQMRQFTEPSSPDRVRLEPAERLVDIVESRRRVVLLGPSGAGKSWLLVHLGKEWIHRHGGCVSGDRLPIRVRLVDFNQTKNVEDMIVNSICRCLEVDSRFEVKEWLNSPNGRSEDVLLLFDGYNEILSDNRWLFDNQFDNFLLHRKNRVIVSTRAYNSEFMLSDWPRAVVSTLVPDQIRSFFAVQLGEPGKQIYDRQVKGSPQLTSLAKNPFYLNALVRYIRERRIANIPPSRAGLIGELVATSIKRKLADENVPRGTFASPPKVKAFLAAIAHGSLCLTSRPFVHPQDTEQLWKDGTTNVDDVLQFAELVGILASSGTGDSGDEDARVLFVHDLVRDYFAARYMFSQLCNSMSTFLHQFADEYLEDMRWNESILMLADLFKTDSSCSDLISILLRHDLLFGATFVAGLSEVSQELAVNTVQRLDSWSFANCDEINWFVKPNELHGMILAKLPSNTLKILYRQLPVGSVAWSRVVSAYAWKGGDYWKDLFPVRHDCEDVRDLVIWVTLAKIPSFDALEKLISLFQSVARSEDELKQELRKSAVVESFGDNSFGLSGSGLLNLLEATTNSDLLMVLSHLVRNVDFGPEHLVRLEGLPDVVDRDAVRDAIEKVRSNTRQQLGLGFTQTCGEDEARPLSSRILDLRTMMRNGEQKRVCEIVRRTLREIADDDYNNVALFALLGELGCSKARDSLLHFLLNTSRYIPPRAIVPFARHCDFRKTLEARRSSSSPDTRARVTVALAVTEDARAATDLIPIIEAGLRPSVNQEFDAALPHDSQEREKSTYIGVAFSTMAMALEALAQRIGWMPLPLIETWIRGRREREGWLRTALRSFVSLGCVSRHQSRKDCREVLLELKKVADVYAGRGSHVVATDFELVARQMLYQMGWRFPKEFGGWPLNTERPSRVSVSLGYEELKALLGWIGTAEK